MARNEFAKGIEGDWLTKYREKLSIASSYAFHNTGWAKDLWEQMELFDASEYGKTPGATTEE